MMTRDWCVERMMLYKKRTWENDAIKMINFILNRLRFLFFFAFQFKSNQRDSWAIFHNQFWYTLSKRLWRRRYYISLTLAALNNYFFLSVGTLNTARGILVCDLLSVFSPTKYITKENINNRLIKLNRFDFALATNKYKQERHYTTLLTILL